MDKIKRVLKIVDYTWPIAYAIILIIGVVCSPSSENTGDVLLKGTVVVASITLVVISCIRLCRVNFKEEAMLDEYEKLYLNEQLSNKEIDSLMEEKYGEHYNKFQ